MYLLLLIGAATLTCDPLGLREGESLSASGLQIYVRVAKTDTSFTAESERGRALDSQLVAAVAAEPPDWKLIRRLQNDAQVQRANFTRAGHNQMLALLRAFTARDRAIFLKASFSGPGHRVAVDVLQANADSTDAVRKEIYDTAECLAHDRSRLEQLLTDILRLELERQKLSYVWSAGVDASLSPSERITTLRKRYPRGGPPPILRVVPKPVP